MRKWKIWMFCTHISVFKYVWRERKLLFLLLLLLFLLLLLLVHLLRLMMAIVTRSKRTRTVSSSDRAAYTCLHRYKCRENEIVKETLLSRNISSMKKHKSNNLQRPQFGKVMEGSFLNIRDFIVTQHSVRYGFA